MTDYTEVSRKALKQDRVAMCSCFGCKTVKRVKPLKFGFFGFGRHPKCKVHRVPLVYLDERIGEFVSGTLACLFDKSGLPPKELVVLVKDKFPDDLNAFVSAWVYSIIIGRGAPVASHYLDAITTAYMGNLTKKQVKALNLDITDKKKLAKALKDNEEIIKGIKEMAHQYARFLKHLRVHSEVLVNIQELEPISDRLRSALEAWQSVMMKEEKKLWKIQEKQDIPLSTVKRFYDDVLNANICGCLLSISPERNKKKTITAFDRFSAYFEFRKEGLAVKFTKSDIKDLRKNNKIRSQLNRSAKINNQNRLSYSEMFLPEELEFLEEESINILKIDSKWSWLSKDLAEKYFLSVLLPYYIIEPNLNRNKLSLLGFSPFLKKIKKIKDIHFSKLKEKYLKHDKRKLLHLMNTNFGEDRIRRKLQNATSKINNLTDRILDKVILGTDYSLFEEFLLKTHKN
ncbi:MAG: hypothetical protein GF353_20205, partial [Candidatus Lokiarchaeota archaeon]|nr:hypothetical protein [Candidatus Lokiarchaeota archaeon]